MSALDVERWVLGVIIPVSAFRFPLFPSHFAFGAAACRDGSRSVLGVRSRNVLDRDRFARGPQYTLGIMRSRRLTGYDAASLGGYFTFSFPCANAFLPGTKMLNQSHMPGSQDTRSSGDAWFGTTHWSVVLNARRTDSTSARQALETLCRHYWYPLYAFVRRLGYSPHDAEDLVQSFFARCLEKNYLEAADRTKGRFRSFLLMALKRFLANEWDKARARKRGGGIPPIALDALNAEARYEYEPTDQKSADHLFERRWALTLLENVLGRLGQEQAEAGRSAQFEVLKDCLVGGGGTPYAQVGDRLGTSEAAVKVAIHRLRRRYRELLEEEIAQTVGSPEEVAEERRYLLSVISQ